MLLLADLDQIIHDLVRSPFCSPLAAYVAEGALDPDQAIAMLDAGRSRPISTDSDA